MKNMQNYLVVGTPITQSLSPRLHNSVYQELGLSRELSAFDPGDPDGFYQLVDGLRTSEYQGLCVTIPYKLAAYNACDTLSPTAQRTGAVNYIRREADGSLTGENTDAQGFAQAVKLQLNLDFKGICAVVCGSGGASRAIVDALIQGGAQEVTLVSRDAGRAEKAAKATKGYGIARPDSLELDQVEPAQPGRIRTIDYEALYAGKHRYDLLVNATPLGMNDGAMPVTASWLIVNVSAVYDAVYRKSGTTALVAAAHQADIAAADGRSMLIEQAILGMQFWGIHTDPAVLRSIIDAALL